MLEYLYEYTEPASLTILPTYQCNAACRECCFCSGPHLTQRLSKESIKANILKAHTHFPKLKLVVFSGGECFLLKDELIECISYCSELGLAIRCVTNGFWGKTENKASEIANKVAEAGCSEINISTGIEHQEWVPFSSVVNAATALVDQKIRVVMMFEKDNADSQVLNSALSDPRFQALRRSPFFQHRINAWMYFNGKHLDHGEPVDRTILHGSCEQLLTNIVITPNNFVSACCGLTFEYIPEMTLGNVEEMECNIRDLYFSQLDDFLKLLIKTDGPYETLEKYYGNIEEVAKKLPAINHKCEACLILHELERTQGRVRQSMRNTSVLQRVIQNLALTQFIADKKRIADET